MACITEGSEGFPGSNGNIPFDNGMLSEMLLAARLQHLRARQVAPHARPSRYRPPGPTTGGRSAADSNGITGSSAAIRISTIRISSTIITSIEPPKTPEEGYHLTVDLVDKAIAFIADSKQVAPNKPFFMYFCPGAMHAPHHVPKEWADRYKGAFDDGWDAYRDKTFARQKAARYHSQRCRDSRATIPTSRTGTRFRPTSADSTRG